MAENSKLRYGNKRPYAMSLYGDTKQTIRSQATRLVTGKRRAVQFRGQMSVGLRDLAESP